MGNALSLTHLLQYSPKESNYVKFEGILNKAVGYAYKTFQFELYKEEPDSDTPSMIIFRFNKDSEDKKLRKSFYDLFHYSGSYNLDYETTKKNFFLDVSNNGVIPLGDSVVVLKDTGFTVPSTGQDISVHVSFQSIENYQKYHKEEEEEEES